MKPNRSVPPATVVPVLSYPDVRAAVSWLSAAFGFVERTRIGESHRAQMSIGVDGAMIVAERRDGKPAHDGGVTHLIRVRVEDVGAQFERACAHGARVLEAPTDREYGERDCTVEDVAGHLKINTQLTHYRLVAVACRHPVRNHAAAAPRCDYLCQVCQVGQADSRWQ